MIIRIKYKKNEGINADFLYLSWTKTRFDDLQKLVKFDRTCSLI